MTQRQEIFSLMGGRVQMRRGRYNPTSDAVWLAAAAGDTHAKTILDIGIGTGGAALCMAAHNPNAKITGIDVSPEMLAECEENAKLNDRDVELINSDILSWRTARTFDVVITNPPYFFGTPAKHNAHHNANLDAWVRRAVARVRPRGMFYIIVDTTRTADVISAMHPTCGDINIFPLIGAKRTAERVIIWGRVGVKTGTTLHTGISMNYEPILRDGLTIADALGKLC